MPNAKTQTKSNDIENIRSDVESLKTNIMALSKQVEAEGKLTAADVKAKAKENITELRQRMHENISNFQDYSKDQFAVVEKEIKNRPAQSVAIAFGAGVLLSALLRRGR